MQKIREMLKPGGLFYVDRNVFVDQEAYYKQPIFDLEDFFGINHMMNFWPGRAQFLEYLSCFFDVREKVEYNFGETLGYKCQMFGAFCTKLPAVNSQKVMTNYYTSHLNELQNRAVKSSVADLTWLADKGIRRVAIYGDATAAPRLKEFCVTHKIFDVLWVGQADVERFDERPASVERVNLDSVDAILIATFTLADEFAARLRERGCERPILPCLRGGLPSMDAVTSAGNRIQMKAFLPAHLSGKRV